jgi:hypothetical protein
MIESATWRYSFRVSVVVLIAVDLDRFGHEAQCGPTTSRAAPLVGTEAVTTDAEVHDRDMVSIRSRERGRLTPRLRAPA